MPGIPALEGWRREDPLGLLASSLAELQVRAPGSEREDPLGWLASSLAVLQVRVPGSERNRNSMEYAYNKWEKAQGPLLAPVLAVTYVCTRTHMRAPPTHMHTYSHTNKK